MRFITRTKVVLGAAGLVLALALQGIPQGHAATGGTTGGLSADQTITSTASGVTTTAAFPGGGSTATCFIQATSKSGAQTNAVGACSGYTLTVTCASSQFNSVPAGPLNGAAVTINGTASDAGTYDIGVGGCPADVNNAAPSGVSPSSAAALSGYAAGDTIVWFINNDTNAGRNGCFVYYEGTSGSTQQCFANVAAGPNGTFYAVTATASSGTLYQTKAASGTGASANLTLGGVFIIHQAGSGGATATSTTAAGPTATATAGGPPLPPTYVPTPITPPPGPPTDTPTVTPTPTNTPVPPTATPVPPTATSAPAATDTPTPKPVAKPTNTATAAPTSPPPATVKPAKTTPVKVPTIPPTGAGGMYVYSSKSASQLSKAALTSAAPASLPQTGGADGNDPVNPLAPLALLGAVAVIAGRAIRRVRKS